jgi:hypothetical protein
MSYVDFLNEMRENANIKSYNVEHKPNGTTVVSKMCTVNEEIYLVTVDTNKYHRWNYGECVQDVFPELFPEQREFLITSLTPDEWEEVMYFPEDEE